MGSGGSKQTSNTNADPKSSDCKTSEKTNESSINKNAKSPPQGTAEVKKTPPSNTQLPQKEQVATIANTNTSGERKETAQEKITGNKSTDSKGDNPVETKGGNSNTMEDEDFVEPEDQRKFDDAVCSACVLVKPDSLMKKLTKNVTKLQLSRALPWQYNFYDILSKLSNLQVRL
jgi:hypothetical protein